jgi:hypothetical protein
VLRSDLGVYGYRRDKKVVGDNGAFFGAPLQPAWNAEQHKPMTGWRFGGEHVCGACAYRSTIRF